MSALRPACGRGAWFATCTLIQWSGEKQPKTCDFCGGPLRGRQQRWCGEDCLWAYLTNHHWGDARTAALKRDNYTCQDCGIHRDQLPRELREIRAHHDRLTLPEWYSLESKRDMSSGHLIRAWEVKTRRPLEVDHIVPIMGKHSTPGCHHHLDGLRTLCGECHAKRTAAFATERARVRRSRKGEQLGLEVAP